MNQCKKTAGILSPRHQFYYARELYSHQFYARALRQFKYFLTLKDGWSENKNRRLPSRLRLLSPSVSKGRSADTAVSGNALRRPPAPSCAAILDDGFTVKTCFIRPYTGMNRPLPVPVAIPSENLFLKTAMVIFRICWLCVCYDALGDHQKAFSCNEAAGKIKPYSAAYLWNKKYFDSVF